MSNAPLAELIKARRLSLRLSQADTAWLASVSRNTIANAENPKRRTEQQTAQDILRALGLNWRITLERIDDPSYPIEPLVPALAGQRLVEIINMVRSRVDDATARNLADRYLHFVDLHGMSETFLLSMNESIAPDAFANSLDQITSQSLAARGALLRDIAPYVDPDAAVNVSLVDFLELRADREGNAWGYMVPELERPLQPTAATSPAGDALDRAPDLRRLLVDTNALLRMMEKNRRSIEAFDRLPIFVQVALHDGDVVDHQITHSGTAGGATMVSFVIHNTNPGEGGHGSIYPDSLSPEEAAALRDLIHKWNTSLLITRHLMESLPPTWTAERMIGAVRQFAEQFHDEEG